VAQDALLVLVRVARGHAVAAPDLRQHGTGIGAFGGGLLHHGLVLALVEGPALRLDRLDAQPRQGALELVFDHLHAAVEGGEGRSALLLGGVPVAVLGRLVGSGEGALEIVEHLEHGTHRGGLGLRGATALLLGGAAAHVLQLGGGAQQALVGLFVLGACGLQFGAEGFLLGRRIRLLASGFFGRCFFGRCSFRRNGGRLVVGGCGIGVGSGVGALLVAVGALLVAVGLWIRQGSKQVSEKGVKRDTCAPREYLFTSFTAREA